MTSAMFFTAFEFTVLSAMLVILLRKRAGQLCPVPVPVPVPVRHPAPKP